MMKRRGEWSGIGAAARYSNEMLPKMQPILLSFFERKWRYIIRSAILHGHDARNPLNLRLVVSLYMTSLNNDAVEKKLQVM